MPVYIDVFATSLATFRPKAEGYIRLDTQAREEVHLAPTTTSGGQRQNDPAYRAPTLAPR
jgi:hypothetical protein